MLLRDKSSIGNGISDILKMNSGFLLKNTPKRLFTHFTISIEHTLQQYKKMSSAYKDCFGIVTDDFIVKIDFCSFNNQDREGK